MVDQPASDHYPEGFDHEAVTQLYVEGPGEPFACTNLIAKPYRCTTCNGTHFEVAGECYQTYIRCVTCRWETCVHDG